MRCCCMLLGVMLCAGTARADCGSIPYKPYVRIFEPNQRAVIAFNGREEILLLTTDLRASEPTKVLEVIPFPSQPEVKKGRIEVIDAATDLINWKLSARLGKKWAGGGMGGMGGAGMGGAPLPPAGEVVERKQIGAHDVSVVHVLGQRRFVAWVEDYLKKDAVDNPTIPAALKHVVADYLHDDFKWFAFNVVELGTDEVSKEALQYRFQTRFAYYPLRITRTEQGETSIKLLMLSPRLLRIPELGRPAVKLKHQPVRLAPAEVQSLDEDLYDLLGERNTQLLRIWEIKGRLSGFRRDVVTTWY